MPSTAVTSTSTITATTRPRCGVNKRTSRPQENPAAASVTITAPFYPSGSQPGPARRLACLADGALLERLLARRPAGLVVASRLIVELIVTSPASKWRRRATDGEDGVANLAHCCSSAGAVGAQRSDCVVTDDHGGDNQSSVVTTGAPGQAGPPQPVSRRAYSNDHGAAGRHAEANGPAQHSKWWLQPVVDRDHRRVLRGDERIASRAHGRTWEP